MPESNTCEGFRVDIYLENQLKRLDELTENIGTGYSNGSPQDMVAIASAMCEIALKST
ncbi:MAG: hypothetical protein LBJ12_06330 [Oscillospiraceae bacterium]|jgi:hypothetical protein|nr:hypothetical protein [Oscillospiraceae bacterium]